MARTVGGQLRKHFILRKAILTMPYLYQNSPCMRWLASPRSSPISSGQLNAGMGTTLDLYKACGLLSACAMQAVLIDDRRERTHR